MARALFSADRFLHNVAKREGSRLALSMLVVEDDDDLRNAVARLLVRDGFDVKSVGTAGDARGLGNRHFDFGIVDVNLPDGDGIDLAGELIGEGKIDRVVFFTGAEESKLERAARVGRVVPKAEGVRRLTDTLIEIVARRRS